MDRRVDIFRWLGFSVSLVATSLSGFATAFNVYALALKETFGYTQTQVEVIPSIAIWGYSLAIIQSVITWKFGYNVTYVVIWILSPVSIGLLYIGTVYRDFFHNWPVIIGIFHFLVSVSNNMLQLHVCQISVLNFSKDHVGKVIGTYSACFGFGKVFYATFFRLLFRNNLGGFFIYTGLIWSIVYGFTFLLHRPITDDEETTPMLKASKDSEEKGNCVAPDKDSGSLVKEILRSPFFHSVFWPATLFLSFNVTFMNNVTSIAHSANLEDPEVVVYALAASMTFGRMFFGNLYDCLTKEMFASLLLVVCFSFYILGLSITLIFFNKPTLFVTTVLVGLSSPAGNAIPMSMLVSRFKRRYYVALHCALSTFLAVFVMFLQIIIGLNYDKNSAQNPTDRNWCTGRKCFFWSFVILICLSLLPLTVQLFNVVYHLFKPETSITCSGKR